MPTPSKGQRDALTVRTDPAVAAEVRRRAAALKVGASDYIALVLAREVGKPDLAPRIPALQHQESELPLTG